MSSITQIILPMVGVPPVAPTISAGSLTSSTFPITISGGSGATSWTAEVKLSSSGTWSTDGTLSVGSTTYTYSGMSSSTSYDVRICAQNAYGTSYSNVLTQTTSSGGTAFDFYISTTGTGTASAGGTFADPWPITMLNDATARARYAGKRVGLLDGTYNVYSILSGYTDQDQYALDVDGGTSGSPTVIAAVNPPSPSAWNVVITAKSGSTYGNVGGTPIIGQSRSVPHLGYLTFDGISIRGNPRHGIRIGTYNLPGTVSLIPGITIQNCEFTDFSGLSASTGLNLAQIEFNNCIGYVVRNCYFHSSVGYVANSSDHFSATESWGGVNGLYEYNTLINQASCGFMGKQSGHNGTTIRYNYIDNSSCADGGNCIFDFSGYDSSLGNAADYIYNNVLIGNDPVDLRNVYYSIAYATTHDVHFFNNTIIKKGGYSTTFGILIRIDSAYAFHHFNNIYIGVVTSDYAHVAINLDMTGLTDYNLFYQASGTPQWSTFPNAYDNTRSYSSTLSAFTSAMGANSIGGSNAEQHSLTSDPLFVGSGANADYYKLQSGSPAKSSGRSDGTTAGTSQDMGAWGNGAPTRIGCNLV